MIKEAQKKWLPRRSLTPVEYQGRSLLGKRLVMAAQAVEGGRLLFFSVY